PQPSSVPAASPPGTGLLGCPAARAVARLVLIDRPKGSASLRGCGILRPGGQGDCQRRRTAPPETVMAEEPKPAPERLFGVEILLGATAVALVVGLIVYQGRKANQVVRPVPEAQPTAAPPSAVTPPPGLATELGRAKALCEGRVRQIKSMAQGGRISIREADRGRKLYTDAQAELD